MFFYMCRSSLCVYFIGHVYYLSYTYILVTYHDIRSARVSLDKYEPQSMQGNGSH